MGLYGRGYYGAGFYGFGSTNAVAESVAVIPASAEDEVWLIVRRYINGAWVRHLEQMQPRDYGDWEDAWFVNDGLSYSGVAATTLTGLDHLEGEEVCILGDGVVLDTETVVSGSITLAVPVQKAVVGLPYRYALKPMRFDIQSQKGTSKGSIKRIAELVISFYESRGAQYGIDTTKLYEIVWPTSGAMFTGDKVVPHEGGFDPEDSVVVTGVDPLPCVVRAIIPRIEVTGR
jgi:hypothetical protein